MTTETNARTDANVTRHVGIGHRTTLDYVFFQACVGSADTDPVRYVPVSACRACPAVAVHHSAYNHECHLMDVLDDETSSFARRELVASTLMTVRRYCSDFVWGLRTVREVDAAWAAAEEAIDDWADNSAHP